MARMKKGQVNQIMFTMADKTDMATIESALEAADIKGRVYLTANGGSAAVSTISLAAGKISLVASGLYRAVIPSTTKDAMLVRFSSTSTVSAAIQLMTYDLEDWTGGTSGLSVIWTTTKGASALSLLSQLRVRTNWSTVSDLASKITSRVWAADLAGTSMASNIASQVWAHAKGASVASLVSQIRVRMNYSNVSDLNSYIWGSAKGGSVLSLLSQLRVRTNWSTVSDLASKITSGVWAASIDSASMTSNIASAVWAHVKATSVLSRMPKITASKSALSKAYSLVQPSQLNSVMWYTAGYGGSNVQSQTIKLVSRVTKETASKSALSHFRSQANAYNSGVYISKSDMSDLRSAIAAGPAASIGASDLTNIASRVWNTAYTSGGFVTGAKVGSMIRLRASTVSQIYSGINAAATASDVASKVWASPYSNYQVASTFGSKMQAITATLGASDLKSVASRVWSNAIGLRVDSRIVQIRSTSSNVNSKLISLAGSRMSGMSDILSKVYAHTTGASDILSKVYAHTTGASDILSKVYTTGVNSYLSGMSDILSKVYVQTAGGSDILSKVYVHTAGASDVLSKVYVLTNAVGTPSNIASNVWSYTKGASVLAFTKGASDIISKVYVQTTAVGTPSNVASNVWAQVINTQSGTAGSFGSQFAKLKHIASYVSDISSKTQSQLTGQSWLSNLASVVWAEASTISTVVARTGSAVWANAKGASVLSRINKVTASKSALSHVKSAITKSYSAIQPSQLNSVIWNTAAYSGSDVQSIVLKLKSRVGKSVASKSALSHVYSRLTTYGASGVHIAASDMSDLRSAITIGPAAADTASIAKAVWQASYSLVGSGVSSYGSMVRVLKTNIPGPLATSDYLSKVHSDIRSQMGTITASVDNLSVASAVWAHSAATIAKSRLSNINSFVDNYTSSMSDIASRAALMTWQTPYSNVTTASTFGSALGGRASIASDVASAVWAHAIGARVDSRLVKTQSTASNVNSKLGSFVGNMDSYMSDIASRVWATTIGTRVDSRIKLAQSNISDTYSMLSDALSAGVGLNASALSDIASTVNASLDTAFTDATSLNANSLKDRVRTMEWVIRNKMKVIKATGNTIIYKDDNTATGASVAAALTSDATSVVRKRMA